MSKRCLRVEEVDIINETNLGWINQDSMSTSDYHYLETNPRVGNERPSNHAVISLKYNRTSQILILRSELRNLHINLQIPQYENK